MNSSSNTGKAKRLGIKTAATAAAAAMVIASVPAAAFAAGVTPEGVTGNAAYNNTGKAIVNGESWDSWDDTSKALEKTENADGSVSYTDIADDDSSHFSGYGVTTTITTDASGLITAINLTSGDQTFAGAWGYKNSAKSVDPIEGYLPDGVTFQMTANSDGTYSPTLSGADTYTYSIVSSGGSNRRTGVTTPVTYSITGYNAAGAAVATEVANGVSYNAKSNKITVNDPTVNLVKVNWKIGGGSITFNTYCALGTDAQKTAAQGYIDGIQATTWDASPDLTGTMAETNRDRWAAVASTVLLQRQLASWNATLQGSTSGSEIDELDTVSGATCTSRPIVDALNKAVADGYAKGVAENVKVTIDKGKVITGTTNADDIDVNANPSDSASVAIDSDGNYVLSNDFPTGMDRSQSHSVTINEISTYSLSNGTTKDVRNIAKADKSAAAALKTYTLKSGEPTGYEEDGDPIYPTDWSKFTDPEGKIAVNYTTSGPWTITVKDKSVTHVAVNYTIGHGTITLVYDLAQMKAAGDVKAQIAALTSSSKSEDIAAARTAYEALSTDVRGFVTNIDALEGYEANLANATVKLSKTSYTYNGKAKKPGVTVTSQTGATLVSGTDYSVSYKNNKKAGTATVTVTGKGSYTGKATATFKIAKAKNTLSAKGSTKTVKATKLEKKKQTVKAITVKKAKGTVSYAKKTGSKNLSVNKKTGKVTVKKGTGKGTYKAKVTVKAAGTANYKASSKKTVTVTVKVK